MAYYRARELKELTEEVTHEGVGVGGGFIIGGLVGRQVENLLFKVPVDQNSTITNKVLAWLANNGAKGVIYIAAKHWDAESEFAKNATKALAGSIVYDTVLRVANHGYNPAEVALAGYRILGSDASMTPDKIQKLIQENSLLRTELNKALHKLAGISPAERFAGNVPGSEPWGANPDYPGQLRYGGPYSPAVSERQRRYGAMPFQQNPRTVERQRKFGAMEDMGFQPDTVDNNAAKIFNMM